MRRLTISFVLVLIAGIPAAMPPFVVPSRDVCFTAGSVTYRLSHDAASPDYRVRIDNAEPRPDLWVRLVDRAEIADLALADDTSSSAGDMCATWGVMRTVTIVDEASDVTIHVSREVHDADVALYVHSAHISDADAAALLALMRHVGSTAVVAQAR
jgi:hypothetical protein